MWQRLEDLLDLDYNYAPWNTEKHEPSSSARACCIQSMPSSVWHNISTFATNQESGEKSFLMWVTVMFDMRPDCHSGPERIERGDVSWIHQQKIGMVETGFHVNYNVRQLGVLCTSPDQRCD
eukprot:758484-Hanusia_phi.AAC.1